MSCKWLHLGLAGGLELSWMPLYDPRDPLCHRRLPTEWDNLGSKGHSKTLAVKGESVLLIMPSRFIAVLPFMAFLTSSSSFLMFFIIWSLPQVDYTVCSEVSLLLFPGLHCHCRCGYAKIATYSCLLLQVFILFHQFLHISCQCLNLLSHHHQIWWCNSVWVHRFCGT